MRCKDELERLIERADYSFTIANARSLLPSATARTPASDELARMIKRFNRPNVLQRLCSDHRQPPSSPQGVRTGNAKLEDGGSRKEYARPASQRPTAVVADCMFWLWYVDRPIGTKFFEPNGIINLTKKTRYELWGFPGSGKSSVSSTLEDRGIVRSPSIKSLNKVVSGDVSRLARWLARAKLKVPPGSLHQKASEAVIRAALRQNAFSRQTPSCVLEEGVLHEIWRQLYRHPEIIPHNWWRRATSLVSANVVVLDVSPQVAKERIATKTDPGPINRELLRGEINGPEWARANVAYASVSDHLRKSSLRKVLWVKGDCLTLPEAVDLLEQHVSNAR